MPEVRDHAMRISKEKEFYHWKQQLKMGTIPILDECIAAGLLEAMVLEVRSASF